MNFETDNKKERGWILRILDRVYPDGLDKETLKKQLVDLKFMTSEHDIRGNLSYLEDKGLIKTELVGNAAFKRETVRLSADGKDVIDGEVEAPAGVDI
jgi:hypothetical protein